MSPIDRQRDPILVTGCSSGIGRATARHLARRGHCVYATARDPATIEALAPDCELLALDVTDEASRSAAVAAIESEHGAVGALVNNAGYGAQGPLEETPLALFRRQFEVNVFGVVRLCQLVLPGMRRRGRGCIVNLSSMGGRLSFPGGSAYHASKHALEAVSDVLRFEVAAFGVDVVLIEPGPVDSGFGRTSLDTLAALEPTRDGAYDDFRAGIRGALESTFVGAGPTGGSTPEEVARAIGAVLEAAQPPSRVVVGALAAQLIEQRRSSDDAGWDAFLATLYPRPEPAPATRRDPGEPSEAEPIGKGEGSR